MPRRCTSRSASVSRSRRRRSSFPSRTARVRRFAGRCHGPLQSGLQISHRTQSLLATSGSGRGSAFSRWATLSLSPLTASTRARPIFSSFVAGFERLDRAPCALPVSRASSVRNGSASPFVGARIQIVDQVLQRAEFADLGASQHHHGEGQGDARRRLAFVLPRLFDHRRSRPDCAGARSPRRRRRASCRPYRSGTADRRRGSFRRAAWRASRARRAAPWRPWRASARRSGRAPPRDCVNRPVVSMAAICTLEFRSRSRKAIFGPADSSRIFCRAISDS